MSLSDVNYWLEEFIGDLEIRECFRRDADTNFKTTYVLETGLI